MAEAEIRVKMFKLILKQFIKIVPCPLTLITILKRKTFGRSSRKRQCLYLLYQIHLTGLKYFKQIGDLRIVTIDWAVIV